MDRACIIFNPKAGSWKQYRECDTPGGHKSLLRSWFPNSVQGDLEFRETEKSGDGAHQAKLAYENGFRTIVGAGGDGTIREVIQGMYNLPGAQLGIIPAGTANVLSRALGLPWMDKKAIAEIIVAGNSISIDLGSCNGKNLAMHAGIGLDGAVVKHTDPRVKRHLGRFAYIATSLRSAMRMPPTVMTVTIDGNEMDTFDVGAYQVLVANVSEYGGNMRLGDHVSPRDGLLDLVICRRRFSTLVSALLDGIALTTNRLTLQPGIQYSQVRSVRIDSRRSLHVQLDGDTAGSTPVEISILPSALRIIVKAT